MTAAGIGLHVFHVNSYLHKFSEPILFFDSHGLHIVCGPNRNLKENEKEQISETKKAMPTKLSAMYYICTCYVHHEI